MLALEIEWLDGVCRAVRDPADPSPEWPVQADRVFSALVASWGARGEADGERQALEWLERQEPPRSSALRGEPRTTVTVYVPPNDASVTDVRILPELRRRQARQFPATIIQGPAGAPHQTLVWQTAPGEDVLAALDALARDTPYVGHSASLVRMRFVAGARDEPAETQATGSPYPGRLAELARFHERHVAGDPNARPRRIGRAPAPVAEPQAPRSVFGERWLVFEHVDGARPELTAAAEVARRFRCALMSAHPDPVPGWLSGHEANGEPARAPHLAIVPMANVGFTYSDGRLLGLALVLPRMLDARFAAAATPQDYEERQRLEGALQRLSTVSATTGDEEEERPEIALMLGRAGAWRLRRSLAPELRSLHPERYLGHSSRGGVSPARRWTTVTPIALDRHAKGDLLAQREAAREIVVTACERIGLPRPVHVAIHKHAAPTGAPPAWPPGGAPRWTGWARPKTLAGRPLVHAAIVFPEPVAGPVILGAGRFLGLGLCLPVGGACSE